MIRFQTRPQSKRGQFEEKAKPHRAKLEALARRHPPDHDAISTYLDSKKNQIWGAVKDVFFATQHRKCGYCEAQITASHGDVEHYRPKGAVWKLKTKGRELDRSVKVRGRTFEPCYDSGYWWLAYDWDNYLFACPVCNQRWKSALFPVQCDRTRRPQPGDETVEVPLLLSPFDDPDPVEHLRFGEHGQIEPNGGSRHGMSTIEICGLDRESLRFSREEKAIRAHGLIRRLARSNDQQRRREIFGDLLVMGDETTRHAGMVRAIVKQELALAWRELETIVNNLDRP